jgi:hypothetical protein
MLVEKLTHEFHAMKGELEASRVVMDSTHCVNTDLVLFLTSQNRND